MSVNTSFKIGIVKQVLSGDTVVIRKEATIGPPPEKTIVLEGVNAPKLARQKTAKNTVEIPEEPYAWEAREHLRKLLVGKEVIFTSEKLPNSPREYGTIWAGKDPSKDVNVTESLIKEGLVKIRDNSRHNPQLKNLVDFEETAKSQGKGIWGNDLQSHVRELKTITDNLKQFVNEHNMEPIDAVVEYVRDGSTVRVCLLPDYYVITLMISGIRCPSIKSDGPSEPYAQEARYYLECKVLQQDIKVILESVNNNSFVGTILHPRGNIAELLLRNGFARCVDWSLAIMKSGASKLREAEKAAKAEKRRIWTNYQSSAPKISGKDKEFQATVVEIVNSDALVVKGPNNVPQKIFLASIRPPQREKVGDEEGPQTRPKGFKPLYDIPWMFEGREFLRKKLIGKKVNVTVDYIQPSRDSMPEKKCCTVLFGTWNPAEALVSKGYATVVRYRNDNDQRSSHYDKLVEAESKAIKAAIGLHSKKDVPTHRFQDTSGDAAKARKFLPFLKRAQKTEAIVEFVMSGSRLRLYVPKESVLLTFLFAGINCPRGQRVGTNGVIQEAEPHGNEAMQFTKEKCLHRDVVVTIEDMDKAGNFIGWMWVENENISVSLVEHGLASMHHTAETSEYARIIKNAEETAKKQHKGIWLGYEEPEKETVAKTSTHAPERTINHVKVCVTEVGNDGTFCAQYLHLGEKLEQLMEKLRQELKTNAPLPGSYTPKKGALCAARFTFDDQWYRAKIEKVHEDKVSVYYVDYGNREVINKANLAALPAGCESDAPYVSEYVLACVKFPSDPEDRQEAIRAFAMDVLNKTTLINVEIKGTPTPVTVLDAATNQDVGKSLIKEGLVLVERTRDRRLAPLVSEYIAAQEFAKTSRLNLWRHGDITEDDAVEFGAARR